MNKKIPKDVLKPLNLIYNYYGSKLSLYIIFLTTLTTHLAIISIIGLSIEFYLS